VDNGEQLWECECVVCFLFLARLNARTSDVTHLACSSYNSRGEKQRYISFKISLIKDCLLWYNSQEADLRRTWISLEREKEIFTARAR
jgi:hypothetical protein